MKIVNRTQFLAMPPGVIFATGDRWALFEWRMKGENSGSNDFFYHPLDWASYDNQSSEDMVDIAEACLSNGTSVTLEFDDIARDGMYDDDAIYAVMEAGDIAALIAVLSKATPA